MGAHLLSLSELSPTLLNLASSRCTGYLARTHFGRSMMPRLRVLTEQVEAALSGRRETQREGSDEDIGDLSLYPGYAEMGVQLRQAEDRLAGVLLWSRIDPQPAEAMLYPAPVPDGPQPEGHAALQGRVVALLADLRQGLRIEARYRQSLPSDLDAILFGPLDGAIRRRRDRSRRAEGHRRQVVGARRAAEPGRRDDPSVGAGPIGY